MKKIDLGQTVTILANVGVLIGILLLVYEGVHTDPQTLEYWDRMKGGFSPEFVAEIDALISDTEESVFVVVGCA